MKNTPYHRKTQTDIDEPDLFKNEFKDFFNQKIEEKNQQGSFENHYSNVLKQVENDQLKGKKKRFDNLETNLNNQVKNYNDKGTVFFMDSDILQSNILDLNEDKMS